MHRSPTIGLPLLIFAFLMHAASAQGTNQIKATAPEKMMPADKAEKMRECQRRGQTIAGQSPPLSAVVQKRANASAVGLSALCQ